MPERRVFDTAASRCEGGFNFGQKGGIFGQLMLNLVVVVILLQELLGVFWVIEVDG